MLEIEKDIYFLKQVTYSQEVAKECTGNFCAPFNIFLKYLGINFLVLGIYNMHTYIYRKRLDEAGICDIKAESSNIDMLMTH